MKIINKTALFLLVFTSIIFSEVVTIKLSGTVDFGMDYLVKRSLKDLTKSDTVIFRVNTNGGRVDAALEISDRIFASPAFSIAFIEQKALSAGALISVACNKIAMQRGSTIGDCAPIVMSSKGPEILGEKIQSPLRAKFRVYAKESGYPTSLAEAMVTPELSVYRVVVDDKESYLDSAALAIKNYSKDAKIELYNRSGELLTLSDSEAEDVGFSIGSYTDFTTFTSESKITAGETTARSWSEYFVAFIGSIAPFLMTIGMAALYIETKSPGIGVAGAVGVVALVLVYTAQYMAGLAEHTELLLLAVGLVLLMAEVFIIPGFGVAGVVGIVAIAASALLSLQNFTLPSPEIPWQQELFAQNLNSMILALGAATVLVILFFIILFPRVKRLIPGPILSETLNNPSDNKSAWEVGTEGVVVKDLRPVGVVDLNGKRVDAHSEEGVIDAGSKVRVVGESYNEVLVEEI
jgi:membrane-bound serine protease (ClpP class)